MIQQAAVEYIRAQINAGVPPETIKQNLISNGWNPQDVEDSLKSVLETQKQQISQQSVSPEPSESSAGQEPKQEPRPEGPSVVVASGKSLIGIGDLFSGTFNLFKSRIKTILALVIIPMLLTIVIGAINAGIMFSIMGTAFSHIPTFGGPVPDAYQDTLIVPESEPSSLPAMLLQEFGVYAIVLLLVSLAFMYINIWFQIAIIQAIHDQSLGFKQALSETKKKVLPYLWILFLFGMIINTGFILLIIPAFIFITWFSLALYIYVVEDLKGTKALARSKEYVKGYALGVFGRLFLLGLASFLGMLIILIGASILDSIIFGENSFGLISPILNIVFSMLITPFFMCSGYLLYQSLASLKPDLFGTVPQNLKGVKILAMVSLLVGIVGPILILGGTILAAINPVQQQSRARDAQTKANLYKLQLQLRSYYIENNRYPSTLASLTVGESTSPLSMFGSNLPSYVVTDGGEDFRLCIELEEGNAFCMTSSGEEGTSADIDSRTPLPSDTLQTPDFDDAVPPAIGTISPPSLLNN